MDLFDYMRKTNQENDSPLAMRLRPRTLEEVVGQQHIVGKDKLLYRAIKADKLSSIIFYGPPGTGKTTLAKVIANTTSADFCQINATVAGKKEMEDVVERAKNNLGMYGKKTILFVDEIHRFNKMQQDALLSHCENGTITLIGATTENPYYSLNNALLSRVMIFEFKALERKDIEKIVRRGIEKLELKDVSDEIIECILDISQGDSRIALNYLELYKNSCTDLKLEEVLEIFRTRQASYHKAEDKYNLISAMIKSMRGSDPDSALYWLGRLLAGGEDPRYIARRLVVHASEDIGMANPEAMLVANSAMMASERIGMPEIRIILAQAVIYIAISTKSNSCYMGIAKALEDIENGDMEAVPQNICHNPKGYLYPHDYQGNFVKQKYSNKKRKYYIPGDNKNEKLIKEKLEKLWGK